MESLAGNVTSIVTARMKSYVIQGQASVRMAAKLASTGPPVNLVSSGWDISDLFRFTSTFRTKYRVAHINFTISP